jgi:hypothetical protein
MSNAHMLIIYSMIYLVLYIIKTQTLLHKCVLGYAIWTGTVVRW